ncbi:MAG: iron permease, partial [bacterium]|nr:iron permease [bacterium]
MRSFIRLIFLAFALVVAGGAQAQDQASTASEAQVAWRLLDYVSVDYAGAVADGRIINAAEYGEMTEFAGQIRIRIDGLPQTGAKTDLVRSAALLEGRIRSRAGPQVVGAEAKALAGALLAAYPSPLAPSFPPDLARGAALYGAQC